MIPIQPTQPTNIQKSVLCVLQWIFFLREASCKPRDLRIFRLFLVFEMCVYRIAHPTSQALGPKNNTITFLTYLKV